MQNKLLKAINKIRTLNAMFTMYSPYKLTNTKYITSESLEWKYYNNIHIMNHMSTLFNTWNTQYITCNLLESIGYNKIHVMENNNTLECSDRYDYTRN